MSVLPLEAVDPAMGVGFIGDPAGKSPSALFFCFLASSAASFSAQSLLFAYFF